VTRCHEKGPKEVVVVGWFLGLAVRRRYSSGTVLPWTTMRWKFGTSYDGCLLQASKAQTPSSPAHVDAFCSGSSER
jgi:hypothetical protein